MILLKIYALNILLVTLNTTHNPRIGMSTTPQSPIGANLYSASAGTVPSNSLSSAIKASVAPTSSNIQGAFGPYPIGQRWIDTTAAASYTLVGLSASAGVISATWAIDGGASGTLSTLTGDSGTATPSAGNIKIAGGSGVTTSASGSTVTVSLTGGGIAIDSFTPDTGTTPVVPTALGVVATSGTANQITTTGGLNSLTFSLPSAVVCPGSLASTAGIVSGTTLHVGAGNLTIDAGNLVLFTSGNKIISQNVGSGTSAGANAFGTVTLVGGTATVSTSAVTGSSIIQLTRQSVGATGANPLGQLSVGTVSANTSFVINAWSAASATALQATDVSIIGYMIIN